MKVTDIPLNRLRPAPWNANQMDEPTLTRLKESITRYGLVENLVVRTKGDDFYEVIGGNWRLKVLEEMGFDSVPCVIVNVDDAHARILAQALNRIEGEDDLGLRSDLLRKALESVSEEEVLNILPETADSLNALASMGQEDIASYLQKWQQAQAARLRHMQFQFTGEELPVVERALELALRQMKEKTDSPNLRGQALVVICQKYLESKHLYTAYKGRTS